MIISTEAIAGPLPNHMSTEIYRDLETFTLEIFICKALFSHVDILLPLSQEVPHGSIWEVTDCVHAVELFGPS